MSLGWLMTAFIVAILINAGLMTSSSYIIMNRTGIMEPLQRSAYWPLFLVLLCILFALLLTLGFGRQQIRPIHRVIKAMKRVSQGDFSARVPEDDCVGEMQELSSSYNHMAEELSGIEMFRTDFINNFSHEFKTPIVSIRGFAKQLEREDITDEQRREYTRIIVKESERLANMSANVLLLTKLENQQIISNKEKYPLDEQIRNCILLMEKQWEDKGLDLRLELDPLIYEGDEEMMSHVWVNLLSNAIKFSPEGGELGVSCMRVQNYIEVQVSDQGEGMDELTRLRVFEKFYQGDSAHATEGNGLGLPLVKRIVDLCGGKVAVQSAPGQGTTFSIYLPIEEEI
ncbi:MAG: HAMP domain-containing histidine kinase [Clostridia bacterium]|nr:HAMP domain-containing histidine kinase [Clostridia bacterium]